MLQLHPVQESQASGQVAEIYLDIKSTLGTESVPVYFQYIASYEEVLEYLWKGLVKHLQTEKFQEACEQIIRNALKTVIEVYRPSDSLVDYLSHMLLDEKEEKTQGALKMLQTQAKVLLIEIQIREAIKGMPIVGSKVRGFLPGAEKVTFKSVDSETKTIISNQALALSQQSEFEYDSFFERIDREMKMLITQKNYLEARVNFEKNIQFVLIQGVLPLEIDYSELREMLIGKSYVPELMFLLKDVFPSNSPKQVYTAALMNYLLNLD